MDIIVRTAWAAARTVPVHPRCLVRSIALAGLLGRRGFGGATVNAGVRIVQKRLEGHAWVEYGGHPIGEDRDVISTFAPMANLHPRSFS